MTRVIAGQARGRRLAVPPTGARPTSDRAREGLFSTIESERGPLSGARVADFYAGSGAVGLEALSRGAAHALLVEANRRAADAIRSNVRAVGLPGAQVVVAKVERLVATGPPTASDGRAGYDVIFLDPPYTVADEQVRAVLDGLLPGWLAHDALVVVERPSRAAEFPWPARYSPLKARRYGEATLWYGHAAGPQAPSGRDSSCDESSARVRSIQ